MSSYADAAAKGPAQSDADKVPAPVPEIAHDDSDVHSIDSLNDSLHIVGGVNSIPSYADQQRAEEEAAEARRAVENTANKVSNEAQDFKDRAESSAKQLGKDADKNLSQAKDTAEKDLSQAKDKAEKDLSKAKDVASDKLSEAKDVASKEYSKAKDVAGKEYSKAKKELSAGADKAEQNAKKAEQWADKNKGNPVVVGNAVVITALAGLLGVGAYRLHQANALTWKVAGTWAGLVGLFAVGDYFVSQQLFKRYPPK